MISINPLSTQNLSHVAKYYAISLVITIVTIIILLIVNVLLSNISGVTRMVIGIVVMLCSTIAILTSYESWIGCKVVGDEYTN